MWTKVQPDGLIRRGCRGKKPFFSQTTQWPPNPLRGKSKNGVGVVNSSTLGVIGVGSPGGVRGRGDRKNPRRRSGPSLHPHSRLLTVGRQRGDGSPETSGGGLGMATAGGERRSVMDGQPHDAGPENRQPFPSLHRAPIDDRSTSRTDGRETGAMAVSSTSRIKGRLFTPFRAVSQLLPVLQIHFRSHSDIYTHFISGAF